MNEFLQPERKPAARDWLLLLCGVVLYILVLFQRTAIPGPVFEELRKTFDCSGDVVPSFGASFMYSYAGMQLIAGILVDSYGWVPMLRYGGLLFFAGSLLFPFAPTVSVALLGRVLTGAGAGTIYLCLVKEAMEFPKKNYGIMLGSIVSLGFTGGILANSLFPLYAAEYGTRSPMAFVGYVTLFFCLVWNLAAWGRSGKAVSGNFSLRPFAVVLRQGNNWSMILFNTINFALFYVILTVIGRKFLTDFCPSAPNAPVMIFSLVSVLQVVAALGLALICQAIGNRPILLCRIAAGMATFFYAGVSWLIWKGISCASLFGWIFGVLSVTCAMTPVVIPMLRQQNGDRLVGTASSVLNFCNFLFVALLGNLAGFVIHRFAPEVKDGMPYDNRVYLIFFVSLAVISLVPLICSLAIRPLPETDQH